jgi:hypothetical protein
VGEKGTKGGEVCVFHPFNLLGLIYWEILHQNHHNFNGDGDRPPVYRRTNMNSIYGEQSEPLVLSVAKDKKIMKKNVRKVRNVRNASYALSLFVTVS